MAISSFSLLTTFFTITVVHFFIHAHSATHWQDVQVLKQLKSTITPSSIPPGSCIDSWDFTIDPCDNLFSDKFTCGFRCDAVSNSSTSRVTELALDSAGYSGSLSAVDWALPYLQNLDFSNNFFTGPIPSSFSRLTRLNRLALSHNSLTGSVPASLGSLASLEEMYLDNNLLTGQIPLSLNGLMNLKRLEIQGNKLNGDFPDLSRLGSLNFLDASDNAISGELPAALPPSLIELAARNNQIEGNIPATVANLAFLQVMDLSHNKLSGSVPAGLFTHPSLEQLTLSYNRFGSVQVPGNSGLTSQLISVDLSNNEIRGFLPGFMGLMPRLSALSLENNKFSGFIPTQYVLKVLETGTGQGMAQFERLLLGGNYLFGPIPAGFLELKEGSVRVRLGTTACTGAR
ncbi:hypothetical protein DH2020_015515 [Rehmannia glutinosa]|uniref:Uncharacterized protein n=1 Tax=Rehmannia glutinosa TaxID=99300 RepID=A0ABR0WSV5_REHGL